MKHLKRHLGPNRTVQTVTKSVLQSYANKRLNEKWHGRPITPETVKNELVTFRMLWNWAVKEGLFEGVTPTRYVELPFTDEKLPFMTRQEINEVISRGGLTEYQKKSIWEALYLDLEEVADVLKTIKEHATRPFVYPMLVFI